MEEHRRAIDWLDRLPLRTPSLVRRRLAGGSLRESIARRSRRNQCEYKYNLVGHRELAPETKHAVADALYSVHLLKISDPFVPPKPNELESATFNVALRATFGT